MTQQVVVGLDVGTTGVKAIAFGIGSRRQSPAVRSLAIREYPLAEPAPGWQVQDVGEIVRSSADALADCVAHLGDAAVVAVSVSTAMHGLVALDAAMRPLTPLVTWADARASGEAAELRSSSVAAVLHRETGVPVHPMTPLAKLRWFARHDPSTVAAARWWVGLKECILHWLTGDLATELSSASGTGLLDMSTRSWSERASELGGIRLDQLAPIVATTAVLRLAPATAAAVGLDPRTPVVAGAGDGPLGNLGTGAISPGVASLSLGTSGAVRSVVREPRVDEAGRLFCYALTDDAWVVGGAVSNGGIVVRWAADALAPDLGGRPGTEERAGETARESSVPLGGTDDDVLALAASAPPGCAGLVMVPYLLAERAPLWDPDIPGAYLGLRRIHGRAHLVRAAVEGVCMQLATIVELLDRTEPVRSVRATGGALRSPLWRDVLAASLDRPLYVVGDAGGSALGAAALALLALGHAPSLGAARALIDSDGASGDPPRPVPVDPVLRDAARAARAAFPALVHAYADVAALYASTPDRGADAPAPHTDTDTDTEPGRST
ncbi:MAG: gluconokinase [Acidimicrobiales bacterium]